MQLLRYIISTAALGSAASAFVAQAKRPAMPRDGRFAFPQHLTINHRDGQGPLSNCDDSSFNGATDSKAPLVKDCVALMAEQLAMGYTKYGIDGFGDPPTWFKIAEHGTCKFSLKPVEGPGWGGDGDSLLWWFGNKDMADLLRDSIAQFEKDGRVAADGRLGCDGVYSGYPLLWKISS